MKRLRVLIVDDSAFTRRVLREMLTGDPLIAAIDSAGNGRTALEKALHRQPDLVLLDLRMPVMDGFTFLRLFRKQSEAPVLVISALSDLEHVERCVEMGANGFIAKPKDSYRDLKSISRELQVKIRQQFDERQAPAHPRAEPASPSPQPQDRAPGPAGDYPLILIGSSSGGPQTLQYLLTSLPRQLRAAILIAQHLPPGFTQSFAERLNSLVPHPVREARHGDRVCPGEILLSPGGRNLALRGTAQRASLCVEEPGDEINVPSVNRLFGSAAPIFGSRVTGFILTGMGRDGAAGVREVKANGGTVFAESQHTAAIYGMPREAAATGCVDEVLDLPDISVRLIQLAAGAAPDPMHESASEREGWGVDQAGAIPRGVRATGPARRLSSVSEP